MNFHRCWYLLQNNEYTFNSRESIMVTVTKNSLLDTFYLSDFNLFFQQLFDNIIYCYFDIKTEKFAQSHRNFT